MDWTKRSLPFLVWMVLCALAGAGGLCWWQHLRSAARREMALLAQRSEERDRLARENPAPTGENRRAIETDLAAAEQRLALARVALRQRNETAYMVPPRPLDAFFEIASFVEQTRALAARLQVMIKRNEHFGFAAYAHEGPDIGLLPAVCRQRAVVQHLVETLIAARPRELLEVQRERPLAAAARSVRLPPPAAVPVNNEASPDYFSPDPRLVLRLAGLVDARMFRLVFTGQTSSLRGFLNGVAASELPLVVRSVEVEPLVSVPEKTSLAAAPADACVPLITQNLSKFAVVVELAEPADSATPPGP